MFFFYSQFILVIFIEGEKVIVPTFYKRFNKLVHLSYRYVLFILLLIRLTNKNSIVGRLFLENRENKKSYIRKLMVQLEKINEY